MEFIFELIAEILIEVGIEVCLNKRINRWIRYPLMGILGAGFLLVVGVIFVMGVSLWKENRFAAFLILGIGGALTAACVYKLWKRYRNRKTDEY